MLYSSAALAVFGLATFGSAHMKMNTPVPFGQSTLNNSPLLADGTDFPCKQRSGVYSAEGASNTMALGSSQPLKFTGSATHGGGSCQISITYDEAPTKSSVFKVIHSIEGGCPIQGVAGNNGDDANAVDPSTYSFTIPSSLPTGTAVLAWTWFNKIGNREMYMNCAPITITAGTSKRDDELEARNATMIFERDTAAFNALPDMFVANVGNGCGTQDSTDLKFPNPGDSLELLGASTATPQTPTGTCAAAATGSAGAPTSAPAVATTVAPVATSAPALSGGVFVTVPTSASGAQTTVAPVVSPVVSAVPSPVASSAPAPVSSSAPASTGTTGSGTAMTAGSACTTEGEWNCIGGTSFQQCASGTWSVVQQLAAGTTCSAGLTENINITASGSKKRSIRFSSAHVRRHAQHLQKSS